MKKDIACKTWAELEDDKFIRVTVCGGDIFNNTLVVKFPDDVSVEDISLGMPIQIYKS